MSVASSPPTTLSTPSSLAEPGSRATSVEATGSRIAPTAATASETPLNGSVGCPSISTLSGPSRLMSLSAAKISGSIPGGTTQQRASGRISVSRSRIHGATATKSSGSVSVDSAESRSNGASAS